MSTKEKLKERFKKLPNDFTFEELTKLFASLGYSLDNKGNTSGSRISFYKENDRSLLHRPHPGNIMKVGVLNNIYFLLKQRKLL